ncbi:MAG: F0F1 ATP synthase subunit beta, partial [Erysipelothrix sp.]|nr:F0F1 ATP synthase subunit beta [Erysipelothrix sp.]
MDKINGKLLQIIGPVVDIRFSGKQLPSLYSAIDIPLKEGKLVVEVAQHIGDDVVRCISMGSTDGLVRGMEAIDTGKAISVPVGKEVLGRMFNVLGEPIDGMGDIPAEVKRDPIHREAPTFEQQQTSAE